MKHTRRCPRKGCGQPMKKLAWRGRRFDRKYSLRKLVRLRGRTSKRRRVFFFWLCNACKLKVRK